jgi:hypothetical protein
MLTYSLGINGLKKLDWTWSSVSRMLEALGSIPCTAGGDACKI